MTSKQRLAAWEAKEAAEEAMWEAKEAAEKRIRASFANDGSQVKELLRALEVLGHCNDINAVNAMYKGAA